MVLAFNISRPCVSYVHVTAQLAVRLNVSECFYFLGGETFSASFFIDARFCCPLPALAHPPACRPPFVFALCSALVSNIAAGVNTLVSLSCRCLPVAVKALNGNDGEAPAPPARSRQAATCYNDDDDDRSGHLAPRGDEKNGDARGIGGGARKSGGLVADIGSFTFRAERPFHPERLMGFVMEHLPSVLRSKVKMRCE